jgi:hypothetical protein
MIGLLPCWVGLCGREGRQVHAGDRASRGGAFGCEYVAVEERKRKADGVKSIYGLKYPIVLMDGWMRVYSYHRW